MNSPYRTANFAVSTQTRPNTQPKQPHQSDWQPQRTKPLMRRYEVAALSADGDVRRTQHIAPATVAFESAFSAFARGTLIATTDGPCAVEDLEPGMLLQTFQGDPAPLMWIGNMTLVPTAPTEDHRMLRLTRVMADSFGLARPSLDFLAGPSARLMRRPNTLHDAIGRSHTLHPVQDFIDGMNVIEITPPSPVQLYHLCLPHHAVIKAAGMPAETFHPDTATLNKMGTNTQALFLSLFPHISHMDDFGPLAHPRTSLKPLDDTRTAA